MEDLYCNSCKDYTKHETIGTETICTVCKEIYDRNRKRYVICGPVDNEEVIKASKLLLEQDPSAIIIAEDIALNHRLKGLAMRPSELAMKIEAPPMHNQIIEDMRYSHLTKREREADIQPIRTEPKIQRNSLCSCGSGKKYKKCCGK